MDPAGRGVLEQEGGGGGGKGSTRFESDPSSVPRTVPLLRGMSAAATPYATAPPWVQADGDGCCYGEGQGWLGRWEGAHRSQARKPERSSSMEGADAGGTGTGLADSVLIESASSADSEYSEEQEGQTQSGSRQEIATVPTRVPKRADPPPPPFCLGTTALQFWGRLQPNRRQL